MRLAFQLLNVLLNFLAVGTVVKKLQVFSVGGQGIIHVALVFVGLAQ